MIRPAMIASMTDVTRILSQIEQGDPSASDKLLALVYDELRMKLKACPFYLFQRTFMMGPIAVLSAGLVRSRDVKPDFLVLLCRSLAVGGMSWQRTTYSCDMRRNTLSSLALILEGAA